ncbi:MAG: hypothetical protein ACO3DQ_00820 [Cephaloticoccus sp.]
MHHYLLPDGGVDEGVGYFSVTLQAVLPALMAYAWARQKAIREVLSARLARSGNFVAVMSAMQPASVLLDGANSNERFTGDAIALLAAFYPDDAYRRIAKGTLLQARGATYYRQYMVDGPFAFIAALLDLPEPECIVPTFGRLEHTGAITSRRELAPAGPCACTCRAARPGRATRTSTRARSHSSWTRNRCSLIAASCVTTTSAIC